ncbi:MAG: His/Gly/Thr/Pro-type tRNA ligase C-terminal domain-containing protein, partial [Candidatus Hodarchaeales archaeon]
HVRLIPMKEKHLDYTDELRKELESSNIRVEIDDRLGETIAKRIRAAELLWIPLILVIGDKELDSNEFNVRERGKEEYTKSKDDFILELEEKINSYPPLRLSHPPKLTEQVIFSRLQ